MKASDIVTKYISFFEKRGHKRIANAPLVPQNDPTTLFTSSGMQPLVPYLLGETHPQGTRLVNVQNVFRAVDIDEIGDNRHTTFFRMLGNWSLGDYFKKEQLPWIYEFITQELHIDAKRLSVTVFKGTDEIPEDNEAIAIWKDLFAKAGVDSEGRIFSYDATKNWWSRSGPPDKMPAGEPGGPSSEIFYDFGDDLMLHENSPFKTEQCHLNCDCGRYIEIGNAVFMAYKKRPDGTLQPLPKPNVDFGGGLERLLIAVEHQPDVFQSSLLKPVIDTIEKTTKKDYKENQLSMRIITDHIVASVFISNAGIKPANKDQGYILRRLIRRAFDNINILRGIDEMNLPIKSIIETIIDQYKETDRILEQNCENIVNTILEETNNYRVTLNQAKKHIDKKYALLDSGETTDAVSVKRLDEFGNELKTISADDAFILYTTHGLSPTQIASLGYWFDRQKFAQLMEEHQKLSKQRAGQKFRGGLSDHQEKTVMGHTATHLMHQALRDMFGKELHQSGSNITEERVRFDFNFDRKLTEEEVKHLEEIVNKKIKANLPVNFEMIPTEEAKKIGAIGLFEDTYADTSKIYFIGGDSKHPEKAYSIEFCGGPHVEFTEKVKSFKIIKQENLGNRLRRVYAVVG
ncbi:MAG: alanine--tRNA ligase [Candidatus Levyibacteriota bacterium]